MADRGQDLWFIRAMDDHAVRDPSLLAEVQTLRDTYDRDTDAHEAPLWLWLFTVLVARVLTVLGALTAHLRRDPIWEIAELHHTVAMGGNPRTLGMALGALSVELTDTRRALGVAQDAYLALATELPRPPSETPFPDGSTIQEQVEEDERKRLATQAPPPPVPGPEPQAEPRAAPKAQRRPFPHRGG